MNRKPVIISLNDYRLSKKEKGKLSLIDVDVQPNLVNELLDIPKISATSDSK